MKRGILSHIILDSYILCIIIALSLILTAIADIGIAWYGKVMLDSAVQLKINPNNILQYLLLGIAVNSLGGIATFISNYSIMRLIKKSILKIRISFFTGIQKMTFLKLQEIGPSTLITRFNVDVNAIESAINNGILIIKNPFIAIVVFVYLASINWKYAIFTIIVGPASLLTGRLFGKKFKKLNELLLKSNDELNNFINDSVPGSITIRAYSMQNYLIKYFKEISQKTYNIENRINILTSLLQGLSWLLVGIPFSLIFIAGGIFVTRGDISVGELLIFLQLSNKVTYPFVGLGTQIAQFRQAKASLERLEEVINTEDIEMISNVTTPVEPLNIVKIEYENVSLSIKDKLILKNINFTLYSNESIAIVGENGSGKSTLLNTIIGLYQIKAGKIKFNDEDIKAFDLLRIRSSITYISQVPFIFEINVEDSLKKVKHDIMSEQDNIKIKHFIEQMLLFDKAYELKILRNGINISQGQKQRLAIARGLTNIKNVVLFDEPFASLDPVSIKGFLEVIDEIKKNRILVVVNHFVSTFAHFDKIIFLKNGEIRAIGPHDKLMETNREYNQFCKILESKT